MNIQDCCEVYEMSLSLKWVRMNLYEQCVMSLIQPKWVWTTMNKFEPEWASLILNCKQLHNVNEHLFFSLINLFGLRHTAVGAVLHFSSAEDIIKVVDGRCGGPGGGGRRYRLHGRQRRCRVVVWRGRRHRGGGGGRGGGVEPASRRRRGGPFSALAEAVLVRNVVGWSASAVTTTAAADAQNIGVSAWHLVHLNIKNISNGNNHFWGSYKNYEVSRNIITDLQKINLIFKYNK